MDNTQRDLLIAAQFMRGESVPKLAQEFKLAEPSINRILKEQNVDRSQRLKLAATDKIVDHSHERLGQRLYHHRQFVVGEDRVTCAAAMGWSPKKLALIEKGHTLVSLSELKTIADYTSQTLSQLLEDI